MADDRANFLRIDVSIKQSADHALVLGLMLGCLEFEKLNAFLAERQCHFDSLFTKCQLCRRWQEVRHNLDLAQ